MLHSVVQVIPTRKFEVYVYFADGKIKLYDARPLLNRGVFKPISNIDAFINCCTVINGTLAWDLTGDFDESKCLDIDPETIYAEGVDVSDPLEKSIA